MNEAPLVPYLPLATVAIAAAVILGLGHYLLLARHADLGSEAKLPRQLILLVMTVATVILMIIVAPLPPDLQNNVLGLLGVLLSGVIALSSAAFVTNFMAAVMLRVTRPFKVGDFIRVDDFFGKVSARGLFDTEIQTENRELIAIPNATFINRGVTVTRSSGVIISSTVSLGYDISVAEVEPLMLEAAQQSGLSDPFVHIVSLDNFAISYKVAGLLKDVERILTAYSELNRQLLFVIHGAGLEVASPSITRHITQDASTRIMPAREQAPVASASADAEEIVFDKAREIKDLETSREQLQARIQSLRDAGSAPEVLDPLLRELDSMDTRLKTMAEES